VQVPITLQPDVACAKNTDMNEFLLVAQDAARQAGELIRANWLQPKIIEMKTDIVDLVTQVDKASDTLITGILRNHFPSHQLVAEESAVSGQESAYRWYIDPLDGTMNFAHSFPHFAVSIALTHEARVIVGVVYDPLRDEMFCATQGNGATLNGAPVRVSQAAELERSLVLTGFPYDRRQRSEYYLRFYQAFMVRTQGVRRCGSAALDLCYVACGRAEAFWEWRLHPWDTAAGSLIVEEAGGKMSDFFGNTFDYLGEQTLASNGIVHAKMTEVLKDLL